MFELRDYQQEAVDAAWQWMTKCYDPCCMELATAAGKSYILAALAHRLNQHSGKKVLILGPNKEICEQNHEKYLLTGEPASIFSASLNRKETRHPVVFGSPLTVIKSIEKFKNYAAVFIDECHMLTTSIKDIIERMRESNPRLRVVGVSATPFRMNTGYIFRDHYIKGVMTEEECIDPYFAKLVYSIEPRFLIAKGFLTEPVVGYVDDKYDTSGLIMDNKGQWTKESIDVAFIGQGRKTARIISDVVEKSKNRNCVMIFCSTIQHAEEAMESLPSELSKIVTGKTTKKERESIISLARNGKIKYLVSVGALTTGVDIPCVDVIAMLRKTESASLFQQCVGRGMRLFDGKQNCMLLDYAENIDYFFPHGDIFEPEIKAKKKSESSPMTVICPTCGNHNEFAARFNPDGFDIDSEGYFIDLAGSRIEAEEGKFLPAHYGRRCQGFHIIGGRFTQCSHKWSFKVCDDCGHENDIAARYCTKCRGELVNPNDRLIEEALKMEKDPYRVRFADVQMWNFTRWPGKDGKPESLRVEYMIADKPSTLMEWYHPESDSAWLLSKWNKFCLSAFGEILGGVTDAYQRRFTAKQPEKIMFKKQKNSKYFDVVGLDFGVTE